MSKNIQGLIYPDAEIDLTKKIFRASNSETPPLYHYTDATGLMGILKNKTLWASHHKYLNDPIEIAYGYNIVREGLQNSLKWSGLKEFQINAINDSLGVSFRPNSGLEEQTIHFITSLTEDPDLLSQWIYYGDKGKGFSIEINPGILTQPEAYNQAYDRILIKMNYNETDQRAQVENVIKTIISTPDNDDINPTEILLPLIRTLTCLAISFKQPAFAQEKEWRLVTSMKSGYLKYEKGKSLFRVQNSQIIHYKEIDFESVGKITAGPNQNISYQDMIMLHFEYGYTGIPDYQKSKIILREQ